MKIILRIFGFLLVTLLVLAIIGFVAMGVTPAPSDPVLPESQIIVGAQPKAAWTNPDAGFPPITVPTGNPSTKEKQTLGRLLFFDRVLSGAKDRACADCHQPDLGFSDGNVKPLGTDGKPLQRNVPSLYEVAYKTSLFADGRADSLESQMRTPLLAANEMAAAPDTLIANLKSIEEYRTLFARAFPNEPDAITLDNVTRAIAAFERTLIAHDSPFDRFANGDASALTAAQKRGFSLFRSGLANCYKCHAAPTFTSGTFEVTGVGSDDLGRGAISKDTKDNGAFMVPSLRNVALSAPYMHDGSFKTLEDVIDFYMRGGSKANNQSRFVRPFDLSAQEKQDMLAFLYSLTDETTRPPIPDRVPSGLPIMQSQPNPARAIAQQMNTGGAAAQNRAPTTLRVKPNQTIQSVVDQAIAGDIVEIEYGVYHEAVVADQNKLTLRGVPNAKGDYPILDGENKFGDGVSATGDNFLIEKLAIKNYKGNGVIVQGARDIVMRDLYVENTSLYGVYPVKSTGVLVERVKATGIRDAGVYAGQCRDIIMRDNEVYGNVIGIEVENSIGADIYNNKAYNNSTGLFIDLLPKLPSKVSLQTKVHDNISENNNFKNFALPGEIGAIVPEGVGILILGADEVEVYKNTFRDNRSAGIAVFNTGAGFKKEDVDVAPNPERVHTYNNTYGNNGYNPAKELRDLGLNKGHDIVWDVSNWDNAFDDTTSDVFPPLLPQSSWSPFLKKAYWKTLDFAIKNLL